MVCKTDNSHAPASSTDAVLQSGFPVKVVSHPYDNI